MKNRSQLIISNCYGEWEHYQWFDDEQSAFEFAESKGWDSRFFKIIK